MYIIPNANAHVSFLMRNLHAGRINPTGGPRHHQILRLIFACQTLADLAFADLDISTAKIKSIIIFVPRSPQTRAKNLGGMQY